MAISVSQAFHRTSSNAIDETLTLTKAQMLTVNDNLMPNKYFTVCQDDGKIYLYDKTNTADPSTGKFRVFEGGGQGGSGVIIDATLTAVGWNSNTKQQTVTFTGYESTMGGVIGVPASATTAQKGAYATAKINVVSVSDTSFTFECEEIPSVDLPVTLYAGGGSGGGGADLPSGGTTGQVLAKHSNADGDVEWKDDEDGQTIQYDTMPTASASNLGQIVQFIGTTDANYINGLFYECVSDGESTPTYSWVVKDVQTYPEVDLTNVFASGMPISTADKRPFSYSTEEQIVGSWIDGKPLYQRVVNITTAVYNNLNQWTEIYSNTWLGTVDSLVYVACVAQGNSKKSCWFASYNINGNSLKIYTPQELTIVGSIIILYTKTTD